MKTQDKYFYYFVLLAPILAKLVEGIFQMISVDYFH